MHRCGMFTMAVACVLTSAFAPPAFSGEADTHLVQCPVPDTDMDCANFSKEFRDIYKKAFRKNYQAQRNLAYMFRTEAPRRFVIPDQTLACAWRIVIVGSGAKQVDGSDYMNAKFDCGRLDASQAAQARTMSVTIAQRIAQGGKIDEKVYKPKPGLDSTAEPL